MFLRIPIVAMGSKPKALQIRFKSDFRIIFLQQRLRKLLIYRKIRIFVRLFVRPFFLFFVHIFVIYDGGWMGDQHVVFPLLSI